MGVILENSVLATVTDTQVLVTWETTTIGNTNLKLSQVVPLPNYDSLGNQGVQENSKILHTYTLTIGSQVQRGQSYGGYVVSVDSETGEDMLGSLGGHPSFSFDVPELADIDRGRRR